MSLLSAHQITKSYGPKNILDGVSLTVEAKDRIGLIGRNGAGKSTLVRILAGLETPDQGELMKKRGLRMAVIDQKPQLDPSATVEAMILRGLADHQSLLAQLLQPPQQMQGADEASLSALVESQAELQAAVERAGGWNAEHRADAMIDALQIPPKDRTISGLSLGEQRRVALAIGLLQAPDFLVLDEPTNHLDLRSIEWLEETLRGYRGALLLVTHDRYFLDRVATRLAEIDRGNLTLYEGNYTEFIIKKAERDAIEARAEHNRQRAIEEELKWVRASAPARTTKQQARLDRFDQMVADRPKQAMGEVSFQLPFPARIGKTILQLEGLRKAFGERTLINGLDLILKRGDRIGIVGENGAGKTTLIKMILGEVEPSGGAITKGQNTEIVYADQGRTDLDPENTVLEEVGGGNDKIWLGERFIGVHGFLEGLLFDSGMQRTKLSALSGGETSRVALAKSLRHRGNLLILDEPTNDLDLATLRVLEEALVNYPGCVLVISHDRYFLDRVATSILAFEGEGQVVLHEGNHTMYKERTAGAAKSADKPSKSKAPPPARAAKPARTAKPKRNRRSFKEEREFEGMEAKIMEAEAQIEAVQQQLADPEFIKKAQGKLGETTAKLEKSKASLELLYERWEALSEKDAYGS